MKSNNEELENIKWGGFLNEFLWICCGVNRKVLRQCPTDYAKYAGMLCCTCTVFSSFGKGSKTVLI